jgi:uncharacterized protein
MSGSSRSGAAGFEIDLGGMQITQVEGDGVEMLVVEDHVDMLDMFSLRMGGTSGQPKWSGFKEGQDVTVKVGKKTKPIFVGQTISTEPGYQVEGISSINIRAMDKMHILGRGRETRYFEDMKDSDVVSKVAGEKGLPIGSIEATEETHPYILQRNESNIAFLKRLAARNNYLLRMEDGKLAFKKATFSGSVFTLKMGDNLRSLKVSFNTQDMVQKVIVRGWDVMKKETIIGEAGTGDITQIGGGELGANLAGQFGDSTAYITDVPVSSQAQAKAMAIAEINRIARGFCRGSATIQGNEDVRAGKVVTIEGLQPGVNGEVYILASRHIVSARSGYTTEFSFCATNKGG